MQTKFLPDESQLPRRSYNVRADMLNAPQPVLHPGTGESVGLEDVALDEEEIERALHAIEGLPTPA